MRFGLRKIIAPLLLLVATAAQAQLWIGPAAVEIRVEDQKGPPVAGATLTLRYNDVDPKDGPETVLTDARGKATIGGLAMGSWHLEVSHEGFMTYLAEFTVREKGRIVLEEAAQFNVVGATRTMRVQISRGKPGPVPRPSVVAEKVPAPAPVPAPPAVTPSVPKPKIPPASAPPTQQEPTAAPTPAPTPPAPPAAPAPAPIPSQPAPAAPAAPPPAPAPEPTPTAEPPVAKPPTAPAPAPIPPPAAAPPARPPENPPAPEPPVAKPATPPAPMPPAAPAPAPAPEPALQPAPVPPAPSPADPVRLRTSKDRTCFECPPGESALSTERVIQSGGGSGCGADIASQLQTGTVPSDLPAGCHVLRIALPSGARYTGYRFEVQTGGDSLDCLAGQSCPQSTGRWPINPVLLRQPEGTVVLAPFEAGPAERERRAVFTAYFTTGMAKRPR